MKQELELISKNKGQRLYRVHSFDVVRKRFPNESFSSSKRAWRLFLDIDALSEKLLEDFNKHFLLFDNDGEFHYIVVGVDDKVSETSIGSKELMKSAMSLMKSYSVADDFIEFIKSNSLIEDADRIKHIKKFAPEAYLD